MNVPTDPAVQLRESTSETPLPPQPEWLQKSRSRAALRLQQVKLPERAEESWRYTSIEPILQHDLRAALPAPELDRATLASLLLSDSQDCHLLVLVDGRFVPELSNLHPEPGLQASGLARALAETNAPGLERLGSLLGDDAHYFTLMNAAAPAEGVYLRVVAGARLERPIELLHIGTDGTPAPMAQPRQLILVEEGSEARIRERFVSLGQGGGFHNGVTELFLGANAMLRHERLQQEGTAALHLHSLHLHQERDSRYLGNSLALGAAWSRTEIKVGFAGPGADCQLEGLYLAGDGQLNDFHLDIDHGVPHCSSRERFKGIIDGRGRAVFDGRILVRSEAQKSDAQLSNHNLMLSEQAEVDTKPQLEIHADDVQCSHGTSVGQLDPEQLFYLQSRGLGAAQARQMLCLGFAVEVIEALADSALREHALSLLQRRLGGSEESGS
jgi:Fe-S cluster assembly protein SufD